PGLARFLVNEGARRGLALAHLGGEMQFDDGISVPTHHLNPDARFRLVPVTMSCTVPPIPRPERAYWVGIVLREVIRAYPAPLRVAVVATGGLSHEPGGPRYFWVDEDFDRWFLDLLKLGDHERLLRECTLERMEAAGSGGTAELLAWIGGRAAGRHARDRDPRCAAGRGLRLDSHPPRARAAARDRLRQAVPPDLGHLRWTTRAHGPPRGGAAGAVPRRHGRGARRAGRPQHDAAAARGRQHGHQAARRRRDALPARARRGRAVQRRRRPRRAGRRRGVCHRRRDDGA